MKGILGTAAAITMLVLTGAGPASGTPVGTVRAAPTAEGKDAALKLQKAFADLRRSDYEAAVPDLDATIASKGFNQLSAEYRFLVLNVAGSLAFDSHKYDKAHRLAVRATGFHQADAATWFTRLFSAYNIDNNHDAGLCVAAIAAGWPDKLDEIRAGVIAQIHRQLRKADDGDVDGDMMNALFDAKWQSEQSTYDKMWRDLVLIQIQHGGLERARHIARRIRSAETALSMRVDKRFDPITRTHPEWFSVDRLLAAQIKKAEARIKAHPDQVEAVNRLQNLLLLKQESAKVLAVSDAVVAHAEHGEGEKAYVDFGDNYNWVLNKRARAFALQGQWNKAASELQRALRHPESGAMNVSQSINLADLYTDMGEPDKAENAILEVGRMSPYGLMQINYMRLQIAIERKEAENIAKYMKYLRKHRKDDIATWQRALLKHGDLDDAAALLVKRLEKPEWRNQALVDMQHYAEVEQTPIMKVMSQRWRAVTSRPEVQVALEKVGRVESFGIIAPMY